jgi:hypothetical protein
LETLLLDYTDDQGEDWPSALFFAQGRFMSERMAVLRHTVLLAGLMIATGATIAAPVKIVGFDDMSCGAWVKSKDDADQRKLYLAWARGVLTGHNYANQSQQLSSVSSGTVENFIDRYCVEKPQGEFSDAALRMSDKFSGRNAAITK